MLYIFYPKITINFGKLLKRIVMLPQGPALKLRVVLPPPPTQKPLRDAFTCEDLSSVSFSNLHDTHLLMLYRLEIIRS